MHSWNHLCLLRMSIGQQFCPRADTNTYIKIDPAVLLVGTDEVISGCPQSPLLHKLALVIYGHICSLTWKTYSFSSHVTALVATGRLTYRFPTVWISDF